MNSFSSFFRGGLLAMLLLALRLPATAQAPTWQSAQAIAVATAAGTTTFSTVTATAVDATGNVYLTGSFTNSVVLGTTTLTSFGDVDVFVAKFSLASNQFVWAQRAGGTGGDFATSLIVSGSSVYMAGYFYSPTASFGATTLTNAGFTNVFITKLSDAGSTGSFAWALRAGGTSGAGSTAEGRAYAMAVSGSSVYVAGVFFGATADFGATTLTNTGRGDAFVAKLTDAGSTGSFVWAQQAGGANDDEAYALAVSGSSVYVTGDFSGPTASFGATTLTNAGGFDVFVAKLTDAGSTGSFAWALRAGGTGNDSPNALAVSGSSVYVAGSFFGAPASFGATTLANAGSYDVFVAKLTDAGSTGSFAWALRAGGTIGDMPSSLIASGTSVYVAGSFYSPTASFGTTALTNANASAPYTSDLFVAKLTDAGSTGSFAWALRAGGTAGEFAGVLAVSGNAIYVVGSFSSPSITLGTITLTNPTSTNSVGFLATLTDPALTATATSRALTPAQLYPNPARHTATLRLPAGTAPAPLMLSDALGRVVRRYPAPAGPEAALDLRGLPAGLYLLQGAGPAQRLQVE